MKDFIHVRSCGYGNRIEIGCHSASTRTVFQPHGRTFRMKIPNIVSITERSVKYPVFIMRLESEFSLDFKKVILREVDFWRWCVGDKALRLLQRGKINGYDAFLRTTFLSSSPIKGTTTLEDFVRNFHLIHTEIPNQITLHDILTVLLNEYEIISNTEPHVHVPCNDCSSFDFACTGACGRVV